MRDLSVEAGNVNNQEEGGDPGPLRGARGKRGEDLARSLKEKATGSASQEGPRA